MIITRSASIEPMQKNGKVYVNLNEVCDAFGCARETLIMIYRKVLSGESVALHEVHIVNQKNAYVTINLLNEIRGTLFSLARLKQFSEENTKEFFDGLYQIEREMQAGTRHLVEVPASMYRKCYRKGRTQLVSSMQIGEDFGVLPSEIYMSLELLKAEYGLKENWGFVVGKNPIIHEGESYEKPYFTHVGLLAVSMKLIEKNQYQVKRIVDGLIKCMERRFVFEHPDNSIFEYDDYMTMISRYYKKYCRKAYMSIESEVELRDLVTKFAALK